MSVILETNAARMLGVRSVFVIISCSGYYYSFKSLPFHDVFLFIGIVPIITAIVGIPLLGERPRLVSGAALIMGMFGVFMVFPNGGLSIIPAHAIALCASLCAGISISLCRKISKVEPRAVLQVFYTNAALCGVMLCALPFVYRPMGPQDVLVIVLYSVALYFARLLLVQALGRLPAFIITPLMNVQFVWMILISIFVFGGAPSRQSLIGALIIMGSGLVITLSEYRPVGKMFRRLEPLKA